MDMGFLLSLGENCFCTKSFYSISLEKTGMGLKRVESLRCQYIITHLFSLVYSFCMNTLD